MLRFLVYNNQKGRLVKTNDFPKGGWIFAYDLTNVEIDKLIRLGFEPSIIEDAMDYFEVPRFENVNGIRYLLTRYPIDSKAGETPTAPLLIALSDDYILTISHRKPEFLDDFAHDRRQLRPEHKMAALLTIIEVIIRQYEKRLLEIRRLLARYLSNVKNVTEEDLQQLVALEARLLDYDNALVPTAEALGMMLQNEVKRGLRKEEIETLEDLTQDLDQLARNVEYVLQTVQSVRSTHEALVGHRLNTTMKTLTAFTIILTIPTIVSGVFGMNTWLPLPPNYLSFVWAIFVIILATYAAVRWLINKGWL